MATLRYFMGTNAEDRRSWERADSLHDVIINLWHENASLPKMHFFPELSTIGLTPVSFASPDLFISDFAVSAYGFGQTPRFELGYTRVTNNGIDFVVCKQVSFAEAYNMLVKRLLKKIPSKCVKTALNGDLIWSVEAHNIEDRLSIRVVSPSSPTYRENY